MYRHCNLNMLGVAADLDDRAGAALVQKLIAGTDIAVENFLAEALERRGLVTTTWCRQNRDGCQSRASPLVRR